MQRVLKQRFKPKTMFIANSTAHAGQVERQQKKNNYNRMKHSLLGLTFLICNMLFANYPLVQNFYRDNYKSGTQNWAIVQDKNNAMYFANNNGLLQFNGTKWINFVINNKTNLRSLLYSSDGRLYASTFNEFGFYNLKGNNQLEYHSLSESLNISKLESNALYSICEGAKKIYFWGEKSIFEYDRKKIEKTTFHSKIDIAAYINEAFILSNSQYGAFMKHGKQFLKLPGSEILVNKKVCAILALDAKNILFVTNFYGVYIFNGMTTLPFVTGIEQYLKENQVFCAAIRNYKLAFGTVQKGIAVLDLSTKSVEYLSTLTGLQNNTILSMTFDNQANLWLGLDNGIDYVLLQNSVKSLLGKNYLYGAGYTSILYNNTLYLGTNQGLYTASFPSVYSSFPPQLQLVKGMQGQVWSLTEIDGTLFCGNDNGAYIISKNQIEKIPYLTGTWSFKNFIKHKDWIIGCSYKGLFVLKKNNNLWQFSHFIKGNFAESSPMFEEDKDETIWFSHWLKGMFRLTLNAAKDSITNVKLYNKLGFPTNQNNTVFKINNELVFSSESGFYIHNVNTNRMDSCNSWNKLFATTPCYMRLHEAPNGDVWCVSGKFIGLARKEKSGGYSMDSLSYRILQPKINTGFEHFNFINNNTAIVNTEDGFSIVNTAKSTILKSNFKVYLSNISITTTGNTDVDKAASDYNPFLNTVLPNNLKSLRFEFNAPEYRGNGMVQYSYRLDGYDEAWSKFSTDNIKEYTQLGRGNYVFRVKARSLLEPVVVECAYKFSIAPAWYESNFALVIYFIILVLIILGFIRYTNHRSKQGALEMEKQKELEIQEQKKAFEAENSAKKREIKELKNQQLQYELRHKAQELATSTMNLIRKNEILQDIMENIAKLNDEIRKNADTNAVVNRLAKIERNIQQNIQQDKNWKKFEENFDLVYENYLKRLNEAYPQLNVSDKKICAYIKMDLSSKDMAPLLDMSIRSIETNRYRIRQKLGLDREVNLADFLQKF